jgi:hypothetical protein
MFPKRIVRSWIVKLNHVYSLGMTIRVKSIDYLILSEEKSYLVGTSCSTKIELDFTISKETMAFMRMIAAPRIEPKLDLGNSESQPNLRIEPDFLENTHDMHDDDSPELEPDHGA